MRLPGCPAANPPCEYLCRVRDKESNCPTGSVGLAAENQPFRWSSQQKNSSMPRSEQATVGTSGGPGYLSRSQILYRCTAGPLNALAWQGKIACELVHAVGRTL